MLRLNSAVLVSLLLLLPIVCHGEEFRPSNYDECIVDSLRGVSSDVAANAIIKSCRNLFPAAEPEAPPPPAPARREAPPAVAPAQVAPLDTASARELTADELDLLAIKARFFGSTYNVIVTNNNPQLTLSELTIAVWDDTDSAASRKEYSQAVEIAPQTSATVKYTVHYRGNETGWNWGVAAARGVE